MNIKEREHWTRQSNGALVISCSGLILLVLSTKEMVISDYWGFLWGVIMFLMGYSIRDYAEGKLR